MGCFCGTCGITNLPIEGGAAVRLLLLREAPYGAAARPNGPSGVTDLYQPIGLPISGSYDDYGGITAVAPGPAVTALLGYFAVAHGWSGTVPDLLTWLRVAQPTTCPTDRSPGLRYGYLFILEEPYQVLRAAVAALPDYDYPSTGAHLAARLAAVQARYESVVRVAAHMPPGLLDQLWQGVAAQLAQIGGYTWVGTAELARLLPDLTPALSEWLLVREGYQLTRRLLCPQAGQGSQTTAWTLHAQIAQTTRTLAEAALAADPEEDSAAEGD